MTKDELCKQVFLLQRELTDSRQELKAERHRAEAWKRSAASAEARLIACRELLEESNDDKD
jgi:hypothetical protein